MNRKELKEFLDEKYLEFNRPFFIESDPISIPHRFSKKEDIEISAFLTSLIAWGRRDLILRSAGRMMELMDQQPHSFIQHAGKKDLKGVIDFVHRTFNGQDFVAILQFLQFIYQKKASLETVFSEGMRDESANAFSGISALRNLATGLDFFPQRTLKHLSNPEAGSSAKRLNMFLRWMVRNDKHGVDFGIWKQVSPAKLICPLDVHTGRVARNLGLLKRKQNDRKAAEELMQVLRKFDPKDPAKYDFALFGLGVFNGFK